MKIAEMRPPSDILDVFFRLADLDESIRADAIQKLCQSEVDKYGDYYIERLISGLSSSRAAARLGYASALTFMLKRITNNNIDRLFAIADDKLDLKGQESSSAAIGHYLLCSSMIASDVYSKNDYLIIVQRLLQLKSEHRFLAMGCARAIAEICNKMVVDNDSKEKIVKSLWKLLESHIPTKIDEYSPDSLWLVLQLSNKFAKRLHDHANFVNADGSVAIDEDTYPSIITLLKKADPTSIVLLIDALVANSRRTNTFKTFYAQVIEHWSFHDGDYRVRARGFELASHLLDSASDSHEIIAIFSTTLIDTIQATVAKKSPNQRFLSQSINAFVEHLQQSISRIDIVSSKHLQRLIKRCNQLNATVTTNGLHRLVQSLLIKLDEKGWTAIASEDYFLDKSMVQNIVFVFKSLKSIEKQKTILHRLIESAKSNVGARSAATDCMEKLIDIYIRPEKIAKLTLTDDHLGMLVAVLKSIDEKANLPSSKYDNESAMVGLHRTVTIISVYLQLWSLITGDRSFANNAKEVETFWTEYTSSHHQHRSKTADDGTDHMQLMVDLLLSILSRQERFVRSLVQLAFSQFLPFITIDNLRPIFEALNSSSDQLLAEENGDDDFEPIEMSDIKEVDDDDSDSDSSSSADEVVDDSMTVDAALVCSLKEALGKAAETSDNESTVSAASDMSDETMLRLDDSLSAAFRSHISRTRASRKDRTDQTRIFRTKCCDLLLIAVGSSTTCRQHLILDMIAPLIAAANVALKQKGDSVLDKIERLLQLICKLKKESAGNVDDDHLLAVIDSIVTESQTILNQGLLSTLAAVSGFLFGVAVHQKRPELLDRVREKYHSLLEKYFVDGTDLSLSYIVSAPIIRYPDYSLSTLTTLVDYAFDEQIRMYRRTEALSWSVAMMRKDLVLSKDKSTIKVYRKFAQKFIVHLSEYLRQTFANGTEQRRQLLKPRYFAQLMRLLLAFAIVPSNPYTTLMCQHATLTEQLEALGDDSIWKKRKHDADDDDTVMWKTNGVVQHTIGKATPTIIRLVLQSIRNNQQSSVSRDVAAI